MRILGIDPGFERVGIAVTEKQNGKDILIHSQCFKTSATLPFHKRLALIGEEIARVIDAYKPGILAIETLFFNSNQKTAMAVSEARGVIIYESSRHGLDICEYTPLQIKIAVAGYGKADKKQVADMARRLISILQPIKHDDEMDAIAACLTCAASHRA